MSKYPELVVDLKKLENNISKIKELCIEQGVFIAGV